MTTGGQGDRKTATTGFVYFAALVIALGGLLFGYNATVIAGAILFIKKQYQLSPLLEESIIAASLVGALLGAAIGGPLADRIGRRLVLLLTALIFLFGALASGLAPNEISIAAGRALVGFAIGIVSVVGTLYLAEISPDQVRGRLVGIYMTANMLGVICGYLVELAFDADGSWRWMLGFPAILAVPYIFGVWVLPETPRWCVCNNRLPHAHEALGRFRRKEDVERELAYIEANLGGRKGGWSDLLGPELRRALILGIGLGILQRITGIGIAFFYGPTIFAFAGMQSVSMDILAGLGVGGVMLLAASWAAGPACVTFLLISELYPQQVRGPAMSLATVAIWASFSLMTFTFLTTIELLGETGTFWAYGLLSLIAVVMVYRQVPETKGKDLEEIAASLAGRGPQR